MVKLQSEKTLKKAFPHLTDIPKWPNLNIEISVRLIWLMQTIIFTRTRSTLLIKRQNFDLAGSWAHYDETCPSYPNAFQIKAELSLLVSKSPYFMPPKQMYGSFTHGIFLSVNWKLAILKDVSIFRSGSIKLNRCLIRPSLNCLIHFYKRYDQQPVFSG